MTVCNTPLLKMQWLKIGLIEYIGSVNFCVIYAYFYKATIKLLLSFPSHFTVRF